MSWVYESIVRPTLFNFDSERIHDFTLKQLASASRCDLTQKVASHLFSAPELPIQRFGLNFPNPIGLAAGMDKHALAVPIWEKFGFGFCELGGVTWHSQTGNPKPRMFRAVEDEALINRMGFNNNGAATMAERLAAWKKENRWPSHPVGINLGKSKITPLERAAEDYANSFRALREYADFFVVNVSSPNTPNLRQLQDKAALDEILAALQQIQYSGFRTTPIRPILVKVAPDLTFEALDEILELVSPRKIAGIVASNTTITRPNTSNRKLQQTYSETGGMSGRPLRNISNAVIRHLYKQTSGKLPIIGVGGVFDADDAFAKILSGASLVQVYTGLVYRGPGITREIVSGLRELLAIEGFKTLDEAIGAAV